MPSVVRLSRLSIFNPFRVISVLSKLLPKVQMLRLVRSGKVARRLADLSAMLLLPEYIFVGTDAELGQLVQLDNRANTLNCHATTVCLSNVITDIEVRQRRQVFDNELAASIPELEPRIPAT